MYQTILVPLDRSPESEGVLPLVGELLESDGEVILLNIVAPVKPRDLRLFGNARRAPDTFYHVHQFGLLSAARAQKRALEYLGQVAARMGESASRCRGEVMESDSVVEGIVTFAVREKADLVLMYTHNRKGLAKMIRGSVAEKVQQRAPTEVRAVKSQELVQA